MNTKIKPEIIYYTGYTLQIFLNQFENLLYEYEHGKNKDDVENDKPNKYNIEVLNNLISLKLSEFYSFSHFWRFGFIYL